MGDEDDEDGYNQNTMSQILVDNNRLIRIKTLLFKTFQSNTRLLKINDFINNLHEIQQFAAGITPYQALFSA